MALQSPTAVLAFLTLGLLASGSGASRVGIKAHDRAETAAETTDETKSAVNVLCAGGKHVTMRKWEDTECRMLSLTCQSVNFLCPEDNRSMTIPFDWHTNSFGTNTLTNIVAPRTGSTPALDFLGKLLGTKKTFHIDRDAMPVTIVGETYRFFLGSVGCPGEAPKDGGSEDCALPWPDFVPVRDSTETSILVRFYLLFDASVPGKPQVTIETNKFTGIFYKSEFQQLGTGVEAPPATPIFAGSEGTGCGVGLPCEEPLTTPDPVDYMHWEVTKRHLTEQPAGSGAYVLKSDTNWGLQDQTYTRSFQENHRR